MFALLAFALLPVVGLTCVLAAPLLDLLFGARMQLGTVAFQVMLLSVPFMAADQVMSQVMVSSGRYRQDFASSASAALTICVVTLSLSAALGAVAATLVLAGPWFTTAGSRLMVKRASRPAISLTEP